MDVNDYETTFYIDPNDTLAQENRWVKRIIASLNVASKQCLDFGCGSGYWVKDFLEARALVTGIDVSMKAIESCKQNYPAADFHLYNGSELPYSDNKFEFVFSAWVFQEIQDHDLFHLATTETYRVLRPGGKLLLISNVYPSDRKLIEKTALGDIFDNSDAFPKRYRFFKQNSMAHIFIPIGFSLSESSAMGWSYCDIYTKNSIGIDCNFQ